MTDNTTKFQSQRFHHCFDCGYGEKGVHSSGLSFEEAYKILESHSIETAIRWKQSCETYFDYGHGDYYMIADTDFNEEDWEGSQDY